MTQFRSKFVRPLAAAFVAVALPALPALAQQPYPTKAVRLIVPFPPGGGNDILARAVGQRLSERLGQQVVVDNRGGAGGLVGATLAATALPDGYTLFLASLGNLAVNPALHEKPPYDPVRDFAPITLLATSSFIIVVTNSLPATSIKEFVALAKAKPGGLNYGSAGAGSSLHLTAEVFKQATGINLVHVPYKGTAPAITELIAGQVQVMFSTMPPALPQVKAGKLRALGVTTAKRAASAPDLPTVAEAGFAGFDVSNWQGMLGPAKLPRALVDKLNADLNAVLKTPQMIDTLAAQGLEAAGGTPEQFAALIKKEVAKYAAVIKAAGIKAE
ncbi:MAG: Bug family tripartite tricarboxylate transporter substrate binding protein [Burkholderiales bacterium]